MNPFIIQGPLRTMQNELKAMEAVQKEAGRKQALEAEGKKEAVRTVNPVPPTTLALRLESRVPMEPDAGISFGMVPATVSYTHLTLPTKA